jgi:hypothetical protein
MSRSADSDNLIRLQTAKKHARLKSRIAAIQTAGVSWLKAQCDAFEGKAALRERLATAYPSLASQIRDGRYRQKNLDGLSFFMQRFNGLFDLIYQSAPFLPKDLLLMDQRDDNDKLYGVFRGDTAEHILRSATQTAPAGETAPQREKRRKLTTLFKLGGHISTITVLDRQLTDHLFFNNAQKAKCYLDILERELATAEENIPAEHFNIEISMLAKTQHAAHQAYHDTLQIYCNMLLSDADFAAFIQTHRAHLSEYITIDSIDPLCITDKETGLCATSLFETFLMAYASTKSCWAWNEAEAIYQPKESRGLKKTLKRLGPLGAIKSSDLDRFSSLAKNSRLWLTHTLSSRT